jgi:hypothetical protein
LLGFAALLLPHASYSLFIQNVEESGDAFPELILVVGSLASDGSITYAEERGEADLSTLELCGWQTRLEDEA